MSSAWVPPAACRAAVHDRSRELGYELNVPSDYGQPVGGHRARASLHHPYGRAMHVRARRKVSSWRVRRQMAPSRPTTWGSQG
jgi:hypothetical protein